VCWGCGKSHPGKIDNCHFYKNGHPDVNRENIPWHLSKNGKALKMLGKDSLVLSQRIKSDGKAMKDITFPPIPKDTKPSKGIVYYTRQKIKFN
jgi:hypothetical protein